MSPADLPIVPCDWPRCPDGAEVGVSAGRRGERWLCQTHLQAVARWATSKGIGLTTAAEKTPALKRSRQPA